MARFRPQNVRMIRPSDLHFITVYKDDRNVFKRIWERKFVIKYMDPSALEAAKVPTIDRN